MTSPALKHPEVLCPSCETIVIWRPESKFRPFCSERCKLIDLGEWANEGYRVASEEKDTFSDENSEVST